ncbi:flavin-containing monooxygenase [Nocardia sp. NPDC088792]|uniref:flavin-containing monooxygenase n=1 Tax=Nocardia sp. NPDC088792 TaxID=3364332 RepID=UPI0038225DDD
MTEHVDVLVVGAGLSGVGAACRLRHDHPGRTLAVLEARGVIGGTWDLFRYPGVRSDSDMYTLGYAMRPWTGPKAIADGSSILTYVRETAEALGITDFVRFGHRVVSADWDSNTASWTVTVQRGDEPEPIFMKCSFLYLCTGYYCYDEGYSPDFPGVGSFRGAVVHPQHWPKHLDYTGLRVIVIGSGATAITLVPALAETAEHVTMLQRSPTYVMALPSRDKLSSMLSCILPAQLANPAIRWMNALIALGFYKLSRRRPELVKSLLHKGAARLLPAGYDVSTHFTPDYEPWDQRLCIAPDGDLFRVLGDGRATIITDQIDTFTERGIRLRSGAELLADIVVTATGLNLLVFGDIQLTVDGCPVDPGKAVAYKGLMLCDVPNLAWTIGYTNSSWTLKADLIAEYVSRLLTHMDTHGYDTVRPDAPGEAAEESILNLRSGYVLRGAHQLPRQGDRDPWRVDQSYLRDIKLLRRGPVDDVVKFFRRRVAAKASEGHLSP